MFNAASVSSPDGGRGRFGRLPGWQFSDRSTSTIRLTKILKRAAGKKTPPQGHIAGVTAHMNWRAFATVGHFFVSLRPGFSLRSTSCRYRVQGSRLLFRKSCGHKMARPFAQRMGRLPRWQPGVDRDAAAAIGV